MLGFPGVASSALETVCETRDRCGKCGGISRSSAHLLCVGWAGKAPPAETQPGLCSWPWTRPGYSHELILRARILNRVNTSPLLFPCFPSKEQIMLVFFLLVSKQCYSLAESLLFQPTGKVRSRQGEASLCGKDVAEGGREAGAGKEIPVSILIQGLRKLKFS